MADRIILNETSYFGAGAISVIADEAKKRGYKKALVVTDKSLMKFEVATKVLKVLDDAGLAYEVFDDCKPNPTIENVQDGVAACKKAEADYLVAIGGGSTIITGGLTFAPSTGSGSTSTSGGLVWTSSDESVATVQDGVVTAKKLGRAIITATAADGSSQSCVAHVALKGIDVSSWQKTLDWSAVAASGIDFAMIRTGYGSENWADQTDAYFEANYNGATSNGIAVGVYHYSYATTPEAARQEAQMCLSILNGRKLDFPVAFDIEDASQKSLTPEQAAEIVIAFCDTIEQAGYDAAIYSYTNFYTSKLTDPRLDKYDKWVAHWGVDNPRYDGNLSIWQYGSAPVAGASGNVDMNYCYVDYAGVLQGSGEVSNLSAAE